MLKRKQDIAKSISLTFKDQNFGGTVEEHWDKHKADYEAMVLDYQLRSNHLGYLLCHSLCDQALSLDRIVFPVKVKTYDVRQVV